jgi:hypothetical protein
MLTTLLAVIGLFALRIGVPVLLMLLLSEALHSLETTEHYA